MRLAVVPLAVLALVSCGGHTARPGSVARAWSAALDRNDNEAAGKLFADGAQIVQNGELVLQSHRDAVRWNSLLPCGDAPGQNAAALFRVRDGKIVLWHQTDAPEGPPGQTV